MTIEDNHNHFCIYCGAKLVSNQNFCSQCGKPVLQDEPPAVQITSVYSEKINEMEMDYNSKQLKARNLVEKMFSQSQIAYDRFMSSIKKSNQLFSNQLDVTRKMIELNFDDNDLVGNEIENKIETLQIFIDKMEDLINELVIQLSSNKKDDDDVNNLFNDMDDLIHSVKDY